jgi:hypothetical protein
MLDGLNYPQSSYSPGDVEDGVIALEIGSALPKEAHEALLRSECEDQLEDGEPEEFDLEAVYINEDGEERPVAELAREAINVSVAEHVTPATTVGGVAVNQRQVDVQAYLATLGRAIATARSYNSIVKMFGKFCGAHPKYCLLDMDDHTNKLLPEVRDN